MGHLKSPVVLLGDYTSGRSATVEYNFQFRADGTYFYMAEEVGVWQLAHRGRFRMTAGPEPGTRSEELWPIVTLEPTKVDTPLPKEFLREASKILRERGLPIDRSQEYLVIANTYDKNYLVFKPTDGGVLGFSVTKKS